MSSHILITGANVGLGFESARQLANTGRWERVWISARSEAKAENAIDRPAAATQLDKARFGAVVFDNNSPATVLDAIASLRGEDLAFGAVILNAGGLPKVDDSGAPRTLDNGTSELFAMNVGGHAVLIDALMEARLLAEGATIMFAGSEASRGIPAMKLRAATLPSGYANRRDAVAAVARGEHVDGGYDMMVDYGLIKLFGTLWMRDLAANHGYRALAVSPGMTGGTTVMDNLPLPMRLMFRYIALPLLKLMGNAHDVGVGAARYLQAAVAAFLASEVARHRAHHEAAR